MEESKLQQRRMETKSSLRRKPFANLTNTIRNHTSSFSQSKRTGSSTASDSSIGSTQNPIHLRRSVLVPPDQPLPSTPQTLTTDRSVGGENHIAHARSDCTHKTRSKTKAAMPLYQTSVDQTRNNRKDRSMPLCSSTSEIKNQGKGFQSSLNKTMNDVPFSVHIKNAKNSMDTCIPHSTLKINDKGKENVVPSLVEKTNINMDTTMPHSLMTRKDKGKAIAVPVDDLSMKSVKNNMAEICVPLSGVKIKDKGETVLSSSLVDLSQKDERKTVATPVNYRTLEKKDKRSSCPPLSRTGNKRHEADGAEDIIQSKPQTEPPPNKKKRRCSSKESVEKYELPKEFIEQQKAYFKEIDDFELEVEEV